MNSGPFKKIKDWARNYLRKPLVYYYFKFDKNIVNSPRNENTIFSIIGTREQFQKELSKYKLECNEAFKNRFDNGAKFVFLADDKNVFCTEWLISNCPNFQVDYNKAKLFIGESAIVLFNFQTYSEHRKKGYYQTFLVRVLEGIRGYDFFAYTSPTNIGSHKGITSAGFVELGTFVKINNRKCSKN